MKSRETVVHPLGDFCWFQRFEDACIRQGSGKKPGCPHFTTRAMGRCELEINFIPMHNTRGSDGLLRRNCPHSSSVASHFVGYKHAAAYKA